MTAEFKRPPAAEHDLYSLLKELYLICPQKGFREKVNYPQHDKYGRLDLHSKSKVFEEYLFIYNLVYTRTPTKPFCPAECKKIRAIRIKYATRFALNKLRT